MQNGETPEVVAQQQSRSRLQQISSNNNEIVLAKLSLSQLLDAEAHALCQQFMADADKSKSDSVTFSEFVNWAKDGTNENHGEKILLELFSPFESLTK